MMYSMNWVFAVDWDHKPQPGFLDLHLSQLLLQECLEVIGPLRIMQFSVEPRVKEDKLAALLGQGDCIQVDEEIDDSVV